MIRRMAVVAVGIAFSVANALVSMYLSMKTGFGEGIAILLLFASFILFTAIGVKSRSRSLICVSAIIMGSTGVAISYTDELGAIIMSGKPFNVPVYAMMAILMLSGSIGILTASYFSGYFLKGALIGDGVAHRYAYRRKDGSKPPALGYTHELCRGLLWGYSGIERHGHSA